MSTWTVVWSLTVPTLSPARQQARGSTGVSVPQACHYPKRDERVYQLPAEGCADDRGVGHSHISRCSVYLGRQYHRQRGHCQDPGSIPVTTIAGKTRARVFRMMNAACSSTWYTCRTVPLLISPLSFLTSVCKEFTRNIIPSNNFYFLYSQHNTLDEIVVIIYQPKGLTTPIPHGSQRLSHPSHSESHCVCVCVCVWSWLQSSFKDRAQSSTQQRHSMSGIIPPATTTTTSTTNIALFLPGKGGSTSSMTLDNKRKSLTLGPELLRDVESRVSPKYND